MRNNHDGAFFLFLPLPRGVVVVTVSVSRPRCFCGVAVLGAGTVSVCTSLTTPFAFLWVDLGRGATRVISNPGL